MKKTILLLTMILGLNAQADLFNFFDFTKFGEALLATVDGINQNLDKIRVVSQQHLPMQEQWDIACETTQSLNQSVVALSTLLTKYKINQKFCAPITTTLNLQANIIKNCQKYYSKSVPENAEVLLGQFAMSVIQSKMILSKCYPIINEIKLPIPGLD